MTKTILITGSTDGIGKALALDMAKRGHTIHILGRSEAKGRDVLAQLNILNGDGQHKFFPVDLSTIESNNAFLEEYTRDHDKLDMLVMSAIIVPKKAVFTKENLNMAYVVGFLSRYMFSLRLDPLLNAAENPRVVHISGFRILFNKIKHTYLNSKRAKGFKTLFMTATANSLFAYFAPKQGLIKVPHDMIEPGAVKTNLMKDLGFFVQLMLKFTKMISPEQAANHIGDYLATDPSGKGVFIREGELVQPGKKVFENEEEYHKLIIHTDEVIGKFG